MTQKEREEIFGKDDHGVSAKNIVDRIVRIYLASKKKKESEKNTENLHNDNCFLKG